MVSRPKMPTRSELAATIAVSLATAVIAIVNKLAVKSFPYSSTLSLFQNVFIIIGISLYWMFNKNRPRISIDKFSQFFPTAVTTSLNFIANFKALQHLNYSTVAVMRNINLLFAAVMDYFIFGRRFSKFTLFSLFIIIVGVVLYGYDELIISFIGCLWLLFHMLAYEGQNLFAKFITVSYDYSSAEMSFYTSLWSCPILFVAMIYSTEMYNSISDLFSLRAFWTYVSGLIALILSNLRFFSLKSLSVTAYSALNIENKVFSSMVLSLLFSQNISLVQVVGCIVAFVGAYLYSLYEVRDKFDEEKAIIKNQKRRHHPNETSDKIEEESKAAEEGRSKRDEPPSVSSFPFADTFSDSSSSTLTSSDSKGTSQSSSLLTANSNNSSLFNPFDSLLAMDDTKTSEDRVLKAKKKQSAGKKRGNFSAFVEQITKEELSQASKLQTVSEFPSLSPQNSTSLTSPLSSTSSSDGHLPVSTFSNQSVESSSTPIMEDQETQFLTTKTEDITNENDGNASAIADSFPSEKDLSSETSSSESSSEKTDSRFPPVELDEEDIF